MYATVTDKTELTAELYRSYTFDICDDDTNAVVIPSQSVSCNPSDAKAQIKQSVAAAEAQYKVKGDPEIGDKIK